MLGVGRLLAALAAVAIVALVSTAAHAAEAEVGATGTPFRGTDAGGAVRGYVDAHLHITANQRAGGRVLYGEPFDPRGIEAALGDDASEHGPDGSADITGNLLRSGLPFGMHDTHGWPTFAGWPTFDTMTHQQTYWVWLQRAWMAGLRLVVAQTVEDEPFCRIEPVRSHSCSEPVAIRLQIRTLRALQGYVDRKSGGAAAQVDRRLDQFRRLGVRTMFVAHWINNAFGGAALEADAKGAFINIFNRLQTGAWFTTAPCPEPGEGEAVDTLTQSELQVLAGFFPGTQAIADEGMPTYPPGRQCNARGLTALGRHLVRALMARHMLIEIDHLSERARATVLRMAEAARYPLVSSHTDTGGTWTTRDLRRLYAVSGFATARPDTAGPLARRILQLSRLAPGGVGLGTDTGGFAALPGPRADAAQHPLPYPFRSFDGRVRSTRQRTGERMFDLNTDGVAHYGLFADLLADMQRTRRGTAALRVLFRSAEAYLQTWERAVAHR